MSVPVIGLTLGDPAGIGPEIILHFLKDPGSLPEARYLIFGQKEILEGWRQRLGLPADLLPAALASGKIEIREAGQPLDKLEPGSPTAAGALASFEFFRQAVEAASRGQLQAVVTGPVSKAGWQQAGLPFRGHTDYLESLCPEAIMSFWSRRLKLALFTHHLPLKEMLTRLNQENLLAFFRRLQQQLERWDLGVENMLLCGLNPHAGEDGTLGQEEISEIVPAVSAARAEGIKIEGPFPADTVFLKALDKPERMVVALFHDQGLIAFKLVAFECGVNLTLGLPFIRTSPDHGTAFDLAGKNLASPDSFGQALRLAWQLASRSGG
ncbi:MAG: 4-hydroxythreonine-4-phosphate dehydrogenase PdxA [Candidatus Saccharicenans sp.]|jgi:4-hydroxythreonine-4-phosphate dehydrogenase|nr:4-hydroxythreonine-4-phosphate dehydrogenase PdxA [Candidatus Saccharicenans sp.]